MFTKKKLYKNEFMSYLFNTLKSITCKKYESIFLHNTVHFWYKGVQYRCISIKIKNKKGLAFV